MARITLRLWIPKWCWSISCCFERGRCRPPRGWAGSLSLLLSESGLCAEARNGKSVDGVVYRLQVSLGQVEIDCRGLQVDMTEQNLDRFQVGTAFQQVCRPSVT